MTGGQSVDRQDGPLTRKHAASDTLGDLRAVRGGLFSNFRAGPTRWKNLVRVQETARIEDGFHAEHGLHIGFGKDHAHVFLLLHADAVLAAERAADIHANLQDLFAHGEDFIPVIGAPVVEEYQWMQVAIPRMKDVCNLQIVAQRDTADFRENLGQFCARNNGVHHQHIRTDAAHCPKGAFPVPSRVLRALHHLSRGELRKHCFGGRFRQSEPPFLRGLRGNRPLQ